MRGSTLRKPAAGIGFALALLGACGHANAEAKGETNPKGKPFVQLQGQIVEVQGEVSTLQDQVDALVGEVDTIEEAIDASTDAIAQLQLQNTALQQQIDASADDVSSMQDQITQLEAENESISASIEAQGDTNGDLQQQLDANSALITSLQQTISDASVTLQDQIDNNSELIAVLQDQVDALAAEVEQKQNRVNGLCPDGTAIGEVLADGSVVCNPVAVGALQRVTALGPLVTDRIASASCPTGYLVAGCGFHNHGVVIEDLGPNSTANSCVVIVGSYVLHLQAIANCIRVAP